MRRCVIANLQQPQLWGGGSVFPALSLFLSLSATSIASFRCVSYGFQTESSGTTTYSPPLTTLLLLFMLMLRPTEDTIKKRTWNAAVVLHCKIYYMTLQSENFVLTVQVLK